MPIPLRQTTETPPPTGPGQEDEPVIDNGTPPEPTTPPPVVTPPPVEEPIVEDDLDLEETDRQAGVQRRDKEYVLPTAAFRKVKADSRERGKRDASEEFTARLKAAGFDNLEAALEAAKQPPARKEPTMTKTITPPAAAAEPTDTTPSGRVLTPRQRARLKRERDENDRALAEAKRKAETAEAARKSTEAQLVAARIEGDLKTELVRAGLADLDYGLHLVQAELKGKTPEEVAAFTKDPSGFFKGLREKKPYLFGETSAPANTGAAAPAPGAATPAAPAPDKAAAAAAAAETVDVRKMSKPEFEAHLQKNNLAGYRR